MLDNIMFCVNAVFPLIVLIFFGMFIKTRKNLFANPKEFLNQVEKFVFNIALPVYIWNEVAHSEAGRVFDGGLALYCAVCIIILFLLLMLTGRLFIKSPPMRGAFIQGVFRSNFAILGVPLAKNLFGETGSAAAALILPIIIVLYNGLSVIALALNSEGKAKNSSMKKIILEIVKNPLIIALVIGLPFMFFDLSLPQIAQKSIDYISGTSTPLALISLGAGADLQVFKTKLKLSLTAAVIKTAVIPVIFVIPAVLFGFKNEALTVIFVLAAAPTAVSSYIMAKNMDSDADLAGQILALTTVICPVTIFAGSLILKSAGYI
ncbi:MAG: AEC family transporter [Oscillospiraceae bacterium]|nr:AEC family transporter [Oscillospiraceae bacterium]